MAVMGMLVLPVIIYLRLNFFYCKIDQWYLPSKMAIRIIDEIVYSVKKSVL